MAALVIFRRQTSTKTEPSASGSVLERRRHGVICSFRGAYGNRGNGRNDVCDDEATEREDSTMPT